jgi:streptogramin lyase
MNPDLGAGGRLPHENSRGSVISLRSAICVLSAAAALCATACASNGTVSQSAAKPSIFALPTARTCPPVPQLVDTIPPASSSGIEATIPVDLGAAGSAVGDGSVWVTAHRSGKVFRVDPTTNEVVASISVPKFRGLENEPMSPVTVGPHGVWVPLIGGIGQSSVAVPNQVLRIDPATNGAAFDVALAGLYLVIDTPDGVWAGIDPSQGSTRLALVQIDPVSGKSLRTIDLGAAAASPSYSPSLDFGFGSLWAIIADDKLARIDPASGKVIAIVRTPYPAQQLVAASGPDVFIVESIGSSESAVARVNPATNCVDGMSASFPDDAENAIVITDGPQGVYVAYSAGKLALIDPATMQTRVAVSLDDQDYLAYLSFGFGSVWFPTFGNNSLLRVKPLGP